MSLLRDIAKREGVVVFSSNYTHYGDMSRRMNAVYQPFASDIEVYSIDESFLDAGPIEPEHQLKARPPLHRLDLDRRTDLRGYRPDEDSRQARQQDCEGHSAARRGVRPDQRGGATGMACSHASR